MYVIIYICPEYMKYIGSVGDCLFKNNQVQRMHYCDIVLYGTIIEFLNSKIRIGGSRKRSDLICPNSYTKNETKLRLIFQSFLIRNKDINSIKNVDIKGFPSTTKDAITTLNIIIKHKIGQYNDKFCVNKSVSLNKENINKNIPPSKKIKFCHDNNAVYLLENKCNELRNEIIRLNNIIKEKDIIINEQKNIIFHNNNNHDNSYLFASNNNINNNNHQNNGNNIHSSNINDNISIYNPSPFGFNFNDNSSFNLGSLSPTYTQFTHYLS